MESIREKIIRKSNNVFEIAALSVIGDRPEQEDCLAFSLKDDEGLVVLCDGMGGFLNGKVAGAITADMIISEYENHYPCDDIQGLIAMAMKSADRKIFGFVDDQGRKINSGTTVVAVSIKDNHLNWSSVGDSRAYLIRSGQYAQLTKDHTYKTVLKEQIKADIIDEKKYYEEISKGETLINYIGIGNLSLIDYNSTPFSLEMGDIVMLMTDGLYKLINGEEIKNLISDKSDLVEMIETLELTLQEISKTQGVKRDNMSVALMRIL